MTVNQAINSLRPGRLGSRNWTPYEHPEGSVYFRAQVCRHLPVKRLVSELLLPQNFYTNVWLYDEANLEAIEQVADKLVLAAKQLQSSCADIEFGIDLMDDNDPGAQPGDKLGCYYGVNQRDKEVFWLHEIDSHFFCDGVELQLISREHLGNTAALGEGRIDKVHYSH